MSTPMNRAIRVVLFGGEHLDHHALRFALLLEEHPQIELLRVFCQAEHEGWRHRQWALLRRRGALGLTVMARQLAGAAARFLRAPRQAASLHARCRRLADRIVTVPDVHAPSVLEEIRRWQPDLGLIYGAPVLRPALFEMPALGTLGIHHGRVPHYRGRKTTFWEIYNGEPTAGVTIQRVNAGVDTGDVVKSGQVQVGAKSYGRVEREIQELGLKLYLKAILEIRDGRATFTPQARTTSAMRHYGQPSARAIVALWLRVARRHLGVKGS